MRLWLREHLEVLLIALFVTLTSVFFIYHLQHPTSASATYAETLFNDTSVHKIEIIMPESGRQTQLNTPTAKTKYPVSVKIDGQELKNVAFSTRGNASLETAAAQTNNNKYSYKLNFSFYDKTNTYRGLDKLVLSPFHNDGSRLREFLGYKIMRLCGVEAPLTSYTELYINNEPQGLYLAIEGIDNSFLARNNSAPNTALFKPEAALHDVQYRNQLRAEGKGETVDDILARNQGEEIYLGADLVYRGDAPENYRDIFDNAVTKYSKNDEKYIINGIKSLSTSLITPESQTDISSDEYGLTQIPEDSAQYWDLSALAKYFAAHIFIINRDSYIGAIAHNYYLRLQDGKLSLLPWDYNYAFLGFTIDGEELLEVPEEISIFDPFLGVPESERPLWAYVKANPAFQAEYLQTYEAFLKNYINTGELYAELDRIVELISPHIAADPNRQDTIEDFEFAADYVKSFIYARAASVQRQIYEHRLEKLPRDITEESDNEAEF